MRRRILVLAGTAEARRLCTGLARIEGLDILASTAGIVEPAAEYPVRMRTGGFGGACGLARFIKRNAVDLIADATHPFACRISASACHASAVTGTPYVRLERPVWERSAADDWIEADSLKKLFGFLPGGKTAFTPLGSGMFLSRNAAVFSSRPDVRFVVRAVLSPPGPLSRNIVEVILNRPPFSLQSEIETLCRIKAACLVCRNSGGEAGMAKIHAARRLCLPVYVLSRPPVPPMPPEAIRCGSAGEAESAVLSILEITRSGG